MSEHCVSIAIPVTKYTVDHLEGVKAAIRTHGKKDDECAANLGMTTVEFRTLMAVIQRTIRGIKKEAGGLKWLKTRYLL